jgi:hypothetical protein
LDETIRRARDDLRELAGEIGLVRTAPVPERPAIRNFAKREDLFDAAVAVRRDDEHRGRAAGEPEHGVVVELSLLPVIDDVERRRRAELFEKARERHRVCEDDPRRALPSDAQASDAA